MINRELDDDQAVHAVGDMVRHHRRGAVVDVDAGVERLEGKDLLFAWCGLRDTPTAVIPRHGVQVDRVCKGAVLTILHREFYRITDPYAQHGAGTKVMPSLVPFSMNWGV